MWTARRELSGDGCSPATGRSEVPQAYGELKALTERTARDLFASPVIIRPVVMCGPLDPTDRVTYWVSRLAVPGRHLVPELANVPVQFVDVGDVAEWLVLLHGVAVTGTYNVAAPSQTFAIFLHGIRERTGPDVSTVAVTEGEMRELGVLPWHDFPCGSHRRSVRCGSSSMLMHAERSTWVFGRDHSRRQSTPLCSGRTSIECAKSHGTV